MSEGDMQDKEPASQWWQGRLALGLEAFGAKTKKQALGKEPALPWWQGRLRPMLSKAWGKVSKVSKVNGSCRGDGGTDDGYEEQVGGVGEEEGASAAVADRLFSQC